MKHNKIVMYKYEVHNIFTNSIKCTKLECLEFKDYYRTKINKKFIWISKKSVVWGQFTRVKENNPYDIYMYTKELVYLDENGQLSQYLNYINDYMESYIKYSNEFVETLKDLLKEESKLSII